MIDSDPRKPAPLRLTDGAVVLRPWQKADADRLWAAMQESQAEMHRWLPVTSGVASIDDVRAYIRDTQNWRVAGDGYDFTVEDASSADLLGGCGLSQINRNHRFANLYYWVRTSRTRQGVARRAIRLAARFGIESLGLQRVEVVVQVGNVASMRAAEGAGAQREGVLRSRLFNRGAAVDAVMYSLIAEDLA